MSRKVYRGPCPNEIYFEIEFEGNCRNCEYFEECRRNEIRRRKRQERRKRKQLERKRKICLAFAKLIAVIAIIILVSMQLINILSKPKDETTNLKEVDTVLETDTSETQIIMGIYVDESEAKKVESSNKAEADEQNSFQNTSEETTEQVPTISAYEAGEMYYYNLSYEEKVYIAKVVYAEARGECFEGQVAVAATVLNRHTSNDERFCRESIYSIITQAGQYASIVGITMEDLITVPSCMEAVEAACKGWDPTRVNFPAGAKFFFNPDGDLDEIAQREREGVETYRIGAHLFHNDFNDLG